MVSSSSGGAPLVDDGSSTVPADPEPVLSFDELLDDIDARSEEFTSILFEMNFLRRAPTVFTEWLRRPQIVNVTDLDLFDEAEMTGKLSEVDAEELRQIDLVVVGHDRREPGNPEAFIAIQISRTLDLDDLDRAEERAKILGRIGYRARAAVGGRFASERIRELAQQRDIILRLVDQSR